MTHLLRAEWTRLFSRRVTMVTLVLIAVVLGLLTFGFTYTSTEPTSDDRHRAADRAEAAARFDEQNVELCESVRSGTLAAPPGVKFPHDCDYGPRATAESMLDVGFSFGRRWPALFNIAAVVLAVAGFVLGASFVGVEWRSGGMNGLLLWVPDRTAVLAGKLIAACTGVAAVAAVALALWTGAFVAVAADGGLHLVDWSSLLLTGGRVVLLAVAGTALGFGIASIGRHTSTALGVGIAYLVVYELGTALVLGLMGHTDSVQEYRLSSYVAAWLTGSYAFEGTTAFCDERGCVHADGVFAGTWQQGGLVIGLVVAAALTGAFSSVRRRDAT